jgi:medium-chain acyl-[acyl-carrier-protein] hydrolase
MLGRGSNDWVAGRPGADGRLQLFCFPYAGAGIAPFASHLPLQRPPIYDLPEDEFLAAIERFGGTSPAVLGDPELLGLVVSTLRADLSVTDTYEFTPEPALECPIAMFGGRDDALVPEEALAAWREHTTRPERLLLLDGGHFFVHEQRDRFLAELADVVRRYA